MSTDTNAYQQGFISYLNPNGYGFIQSESLEKNAYFHARKVKGKKLFSDMKVGDQVQFQIGENDKGIELYDVTVI